MNKIAAKKLEFSPAVQPVSVPIYELLFQEANDPLLLVNSETFIIENVNSRMLQLTGYLLEELEGKPVSVLYPTEQAVQELRSMGFKQSMLTESGFFEDVTIRKKDGYLAYVSLSSRNLDREQTGTNSLTLCIIRDTLAKRLMERELITKHSELRNAYSELERAHIELKAAQEALVQAGKLAALGELSAGVAHELNQPLTAIMGYSQELKSILQEESPSETCLQHADEIIRNSVRMSKIIKQLRDFTRKSTEDFQLTDIEDVIRESIKLLQAQFKSRGINVTIQKDANVPQIYCNPFRMEQVFINLATNARDAIAEKKSGSGHIDINIKWPASMQTKGSQKFDKRFIEIIFQDDGSGMSQEAQNRSMEPFFTTKEVGKGTGLGLSVSFGILSEIHATMLIESQPGKGCKFYLKLPVDYRKLNIATEKEN